MYYYVLSFIADIFSLFFGSQLILRWLNAPFYALKHWTDLILFIALGIQTAGNESKLNQCCE